MPKIKNVCTILSLILKGYKVSVISCVPHAKYLWRKYWINLTILMIAFQRVRQWESLSSLPLSSVTQFRVYSPVWGSRSSSFDTQAHVQAPEEHKRAQKKEEGDGSRSTLESTLPNLRPLKAVCHSVTVEAMSKLGERSSKPGQKGLVRDRVWGGNKHYCRVLEGLALE